MTYPEFFKQLSYDIFIASFAVYLASLGIESVVPGLVASVVQMNILFLVCAVSGLLALLFPLSQSNSHPILDSVFGIGIAGVAGLLTFQLLKGEGRIAIFLAIAMTVIILLFTHSLKKMNDEKMNSVIRDTL